MRNVVAQGATTAQNRATTQGSQRGSHVAPMGRPNTNVLGENSHGSKTIHCFNVVNRGIELRNVVKMLAGKVNDI